MPQTSLKEWGESGERNPHGADWGRKRAVTQILSPNLPYRTNAIGKNNKHCDTEDLGENPFQLGEENKKQTNKNPLPIGKGQAYLLAPDLVEKGQKS